MSIVTVFAVAVAAAAAQDAPPRSLDPRVKVELFAEHPQIVTPTGIDVDENGHIWAVESNTHFPPEGYKGHPTDRVLVMSDIDGDGKADRIVVFTDGLKHTMSVAVRPPWLILDPASGGRQPAGGTKSTEGSTKKSNSKSASPPSQGGGRGGGVNSGSTRNSNSNNQGADAPRSPSNAVYVATRREISLFYDDDGDDKADRRESIVHLETKGDYPHNGLAGLAFDALGWMYFGFGENLGADYKIIGSDGGALSGGGEGGSVCRCRPDGSKLERWATGFWNPHASCIDAFGRLFTVDNDPDSRPPCRLMHILHGGDYGYRFRNGRAGLHPFTSWNGEIPGTLPMVAGTGEAPSGVLAYESDGLSEEFIGNLFVTSWGDHRIDRFRLKPHGASFSSLAETLIVGGENFRPVGIACAPDGSLYFTDWVKRDYTLHSQGRVWRILPVSRSAANKKPSAENSARVNVRRLEAIERAVTAEGRKALLTRLAERQKSPRARIEALWALAGTARRGAPVDLASLKLFTPCEVVGTAAGWLINSPVLPMPQDALRNLAQDLLAERLAGRTTKLDDGGALLGILSQCQMGPGDTLIPLALSVDDPFVLSIMISSLARDFGPDGFARYLTPGSGAAPRVRVAMLLAARQRDPHDATLAELGLGDHDPDVRRLAVQWVAEERMRDLRPRVEAVLNSNAVTSDLFLAALAALQMLDGEDPAKIDKTPAAQYVLPLLRDEKRPAAVRAQALRLVSPADPALDTALMSGLLNGSDPLLRQEAVRTLELTPVERAAPLLIPLAADSKQDKQLRADAVVGLAVAATTEKRGGPARKVLVDLLASSDSTLQRESLRSLRRGVFLEDDDVDRSVMALMTTLKSVDPKSDAAHELADQIARVLGDPTIAVANGIDVLKSKVPQNKAEWLAQLNRGRDADPDAGRRLFYHSNGPGCYKCHTVNGRGGHVGPDLSRIVDSMKRIQLIQSILEPSSEIAPQYVTWTFETADGKTHSGMIVHENEGKTIVGDAEGKLTELKTIDIVARAAQQKSVMPEKLAEQMTLQEFRDLLAFLESLK